MGDFGQQLPCADQVMGVIAFPHRVQLRLNHRKGLRRPGLAQPQSAEACGAAQGQRVQLSGFRRFQRAGEPDFCLRIAVVATLCRSLQRQLTGQSADFGFVVPFRIG